MKEQPDVKWRGNNLKIFPWTFILHKLGLKILSRYGDRALKLFLKSTWIAIEYVGYVNS